MILVALVLAWLGFGACVLAGDRLHQPAYQSRNFWRLLAFGLMTYAAVATHYAVVVRAELRILIDSCK